ncbi:unnamed protein product [Peniophora sp. CBMAI 1063]|nr:unnamed protein product [Peniophora sp. CBMAI 1063]
MSAEEIMQNALGELVELCRGPRPTDVYQAQYWGMAGAHALLLNGLLHLYKIAPTIPKEKSVEFAGYALQWVAAINHHHAWEENLYYPLFGFELDSASIVCEHATFTDGVERMEHYFTDCLPDGTKYGYGKVVKPHVRKNFDGHHVQDLIDTFVKPLTAHFLHELEYLEPVKLMKTGLTEEAMKRIDKSSLQHMRTMPNSTFLVYNLRHAPKGSEYPPTAPFVKRFLAPYIYSLPYKKYWQFAPAAIEY